MPQTEFQIRKIGTCPNCYSSCYYDEDNNRYFWKPYNPECNCHLTKGPNKKEKNRQPKNNT